ncbi:hypothetical protein AGMMS50230_22140 [Spirochaetia bacterium]|nr:hypothetical protein AGMMS50230_22140 [Spirochaetia bacterium]
MNIPGKLFLPAILLGFSINAAADQLSDELQWLAVQTACIGQYNAAQTGDYALADPQDYYRPGDIREYLAEQSGARTRTDLFYGICFDYAQSAYNDITRNQSKYEKLGMKKGSYYIAGVKDNPDQIILYDPSSAGRSTEQLNGVHLRENFRRNVQSHGNATWHAWLWVYANNGTIYWIDPTWTDNAGYIWWGVVENGKEVQRGPVPQYCKVPVSANMDALALINSGNARRNQGQFDKAIEDFTKVIRLNPKAAVSYFNRGLMYSIKGDFNRAIADFNQAIKLDPNNAVPYYNRGLVYRAKGDNSRAITDYNKAAVEGLYYPAFIVKVGKAQNLYILRLFAAVNRHSRIPGFFSAGPVGIVGFSVFIHGVSQFLT